MAVPKGAKASLVSGEGVTWRVGVVVRMGAIVSDRQGPALRLFIEVQLVV